jgi:hypothetical protein
MNTSSRKRPSFILAAFTLVFSLLLMAAPGIGAQQSLIPEGAPVDLHTGTCDDFLTEPLADAGEIGTANTEDVWGEEGFMSGMLVDEAAGISGVDLNGDGSLQPEEVVVLNGENAEIGQATGEFDEAIDTSQPLVVAVHASPDTYETIIACGDLSSALDVAGGRQLVKLQPGQDSQLFGYALMEEDGQSMTTYLFQPDVEAAAMATPVDTAQLVPEGFPVDIHPGTCEDWTTEPTFDIGDFQETNIAAPGEQEVGDTSGEIPQGAEYLEGAYKVKSTADFSRDDILNADQPYVVGVHQSADEYTTLVACGQIVEVSNGDSLYVILEPVGTSNLTGFVEMNGSDVNGYLWPVLPFQPATGEATPTPMPELATPEPTVAPTEAATPEPTAPPTLEPTPTEEATAVITVTEVITETEVVPAATATAEAND